MVEPLPKPRGLINRTDGFSPHTTAGSQTPVWHRAESVQTQAERFLNDASVWLYCPKASQFFIRLARERQQGKDKHGI